MRHQPAGEENALAELFARHRQELHLHCYRMLGSVTDADDLLQETMIAAWRGLGGFMGNASFRAWLYKIATNRCLNAIRDSKRRAPVAPVPPFDPPEPSWRWDVPWLQPYPDAWLGSAMLGSAMLGSANDPAARYEVNETVRLAFIAALQRLPARQTAAVVLCDVLGFSLAEVATMLEVTPAAVKGLLQRARATTTPGWRCHQPRTCTRDPMPSPGSSARARLGEPGATSSWCPPVPIPNPPSPAIWANPATQPRNHPA